MANEIGGNIIWNLDIDDSKYNASLTKAKAGAAGLAKDVDTHFSGIASTIVSSFKKAEGASIAFAGGLTAIGIAGFGAIGFGVKMAGDIEAARQGFVTLLGSAQLADEAMAQIKKDAATTPFEFAGLVRANQMLTSVTKNAPQSEKLLLNVGKALSAAGKGGAELDNVIVNLQQIANTGKISELDIRQFGFSGINILELLADQYGVTKDAAGEMVKNSKNAFADLEKAFEKAGENGGKFSRAFIDQAGTFKQLMSNFTDIISQTAAEIVTNTGIFDAVKNGVGGITQALIDFKPQIVQGIKDFITFVVANGPIIVGIIAGALIPAFGGLAAAIALGAFNLLPFMIAGAALVVLGTAIVDALGGWEATQNQLNAALQFLGDIFNTYIKPSLDSLWQTIQTQLLPQLQELWTVLSPILLPVLKFVAIAIGVTLLAAIVGAIEILKLLVQWVSTNVERFNTFVEFLKTIPDTVTSVFSTVYDAITSPFKQAWDTIRDLAGKIKGELEKISPFHRNSPSLVDNVIKGVGIIKDQYSSLTSLKLPPIAQAIPAFAQSPTLQGYSGSTPTMQPIMGRGQGSGINIHVDEMNVRDESDITDVARELGFRIESSTGFTNG